MTDRIYIRAGEGRDGAFQRFMKHLDIPVHTDPQTQSTYILGTEIEKAGFPASFFQSFAELNQGTGIHSDHSKINQFVEKYLLTGDRGEPAPHNAFRSTWDATLDSAEVQLLMSALSGYGLGNFNPIIGLSLLDSGHTFSLESFKELLASLDETNCWLTADNIGLALFSDNHAAYNVDPQLDEGLKFIPSDSLNEVMSSCPYLPETLNIQSGVYFAKDQIPQDHGFQKGFQSSVTIAMGKNTLSGFMFKPGYLVSARHGFDKTIDLMLQDFREMTNGEADFTPPLSTTVTVTDADGVEHKTSAVMLPVVDTYFHRNPDLIVLYVPALANAIPAIDTSQIHSGVVGDSLGPFSMTEPQIAELEELMTSDPEAHQDLIEEYFELGKPMAGDTYYEGQLVISVGAISNEDGVSLKGTPGAIEHEMPLSPVGTIRIINRLLPGKSGGLTANDAGEPVGVTSISWMSSENRLDYAEIYPLDIWAPYINQTISEYKDR